MPRPPLLAALLAAAPTPSSAAASTAPRGLARVPAPASLPLTLAGLAFLVLATRRAVVHAAALRASAGRAGTAPPVAMEGW